MPIKQAIDHPNRLILAVGSGELTLADLATFTRDIVRAGLLHYSKLIDVANCAPGFSKEELAAFGQVVREIRTETLRGPLAVVADPNRGEFARIFTDFNIDGRPAKVFRSIHEARRWLTEQTVQDNAWRPARRR